MHQRRRIILIALAAAILISAAPPPANRVPPPRSQAEVEKMMRRTWNREILPAGASADTLQRLLVRGQVVLMEDKPQADIPWSVAAGILIDAPPDTVFKTVTDFDHYPGVIPMTTTAHATPQALPNLYEVSYGIELMFSMLNVQYSVYHYHRPPYRTDWAHASGEFEVNVGFWQLIPADGGRRTMTFYSVYSLPRQPEVQALYKELPPLELMTNVATAAVITRSIKAEAERREGKRLPPLREKSSPEEILRSDQTTVSRLIGRGKLMVLENGPSVYVTGATIVSAPPDVCYRVLTDFGKYPELLPGIQKSVVTGKTARGVMVHQESKIKLWKIELDNEIDREFTLSPPDRISWTVKRSGAAPATCYWRVTGMEGGKTLLVNGMTEDIRGASLIAQAALTIEPNLEHALLAALETASLDAFKKRMEAEGKKGK